VNIPLNPASATIKYPKNIRDAHSLRTKRRRKNKHSGYSSQIPCNCNTNRFQNNPRSTNSSKA
jgi:hypothetical protein